MARLVHDGLSNKAIGKLLGIKEGTVKIHLHTLCRKLGLRTRTQMALAVERDEIP